MPHGGERPPIRLAGAHVSCRMRALTERKVKMGDLFMRCGPWNVPGERWHAQVDEMSAP